MKVRILLLTNFRSLAELRCLVLEHAGFSAESPETTAEALHVLRSKKYDVLVCCALPAEVTLELVRIFRQRNSAGVVIAIQTLSDRAYPFAPEEVVEPIDGPVGLLNAIHSALANRKRAAGTAA